MADIHRAHLGNVGRSEIFNSAGYHIRGAESPQ